MLNDITFDLPAGPANLAPLFPAINFNDVAEYIVTVKDSTGSIVATTPRYAMTREWAAPDMVRLHFLNYLGRYDSIAFSFFSVANEVKSEDWTKPLPARPSSTDYGTIRSDIKARNVWTGKHYFYTESAQKWLEQLLESPLVFMEQAAKDGRPPVYIPVTVRDKNYTTRKEDERYVYETIVEWAASNEKIGLKL